eukprot:scaffold55653_cov27-Prasinocladus_malaysianus.AAC.1
MNSELTTAPESRIQHRYEAIRCYTPTRTRTRTTRITQHAFRVQTMPVHLLRVPLGCITKTP